MAKTVDSQRNTARRLVGLEDATATGTLLQQGGVPVMVVIAMADGEAGFSVYQTPGANAAQRDEWRKVLRSMLNRL